MIWLLKRKNHEENISLRSYSNSIDTSQLQLSRFEDVRRNDTCS